MEELVFTIKSGFFSKSKKLILNEKFLSFGDIKIEKKNIIAYRYGIRWIQLDITFGREYVIFIQDKNSDILKINFISFFGRNIHENHKLYAKLVDHLWDYYFQDIIKAYLKQHEEGQIFKIGNISFSPDGISIIRGLIKKHFIPWNKVRTNNYQTYFAIHSTDDPAGINIAASYLDDWNTSVLYSVLRNILQTKEVEVYN